MINSAKIKGLLKEYGLTQADVAIVLGISQPTVNQKINNLRPMHLEEAEKIAKLLHISACDFTAYFFTNWVA